jgi:DNA-binding MurR/RpiR family transcriptional regulator
LSEPAGAATLGFGLDGVNPELHTEVKGLGTTGGTPPDAFLSTIEAAIDTFSPNDRRVADHLLTAYPNAAWETADEVATRVGVSKAAVIRFAARLGYEGYAELQRAFQVELSQRLASPLALLEQRAGDESSDLLDSMLRQSTENLVRTRRRISLQTLNSATERLARAESCVFVLGFRKSFGLAVYAHQLLAMLRPGVILMPTAESSFPEALQDVRPEDVIVAITVRRYARSTLEAIDYCRDAGAYVIAVSDTLAGPATPRANVVFAGAADGVSLFDSGVSILFVLEALVNGVASRIREGASERLRQGEALGRRFAVFEKTGDASRRRIAERDGSE